MTEMGNIIADWVLLLIILTTSLSMGFAIKQLVMLLLEGPKKNHLDVVRITVAGLAIKQGYTGVRFSYDGSRTWYGTLRGSGKNPKVFNGKSFELVHDSMVWFVTNNPRRRK